MRFQGTISDIETRMVKNYDPDTGDDPVLEITVRVRIESRKIHPRQPTDEIVKAAIDALDREQQGQAQGGEKERRAG